MPARPSLFRNPKKPSNGLRPYLSAAPLELMLLFIGLIACAVPIAAQTVPATAKPYATLDREAVTYRGPGRESEKNLPQGVAAIGLILPLQGRQEAEGKALLAAAQLALEEEQAAGPLPDGRRLILAARDESGPWGQASSEILKLIEQDHSLALITSANGGIAHQAEQISNKLGVPILTLASDPTTTEVNMPWLYRLVPSDVDQARMFAQRIYAELGFRRVLVISQTDHDGRTGSNEFEKARRSLQMPAPDRLELALAASVTEPKTLADRIRTTNPQAVVLWTDAELAAPLLPSLRQTVPGVSLFVCTKAAQSGFDASAEISSALQTNETRGESGTWAVAPRPDVQNEEKRAFNERYISRTGTAPGYGAFQIHDAVRMIATSLRSAGTNRVLLRDSLASGARFHGLAVTYSFDSAGNLTQEFAIVQIRGWHDAPAGVRAQNSQTHLP
jgi:branched-chain amino acid transport system substrate-binding protein